MGNIKMDWYLFGLIINGLVFGIYGFFMPSTLEMKQSSYDLEKIWAFMKFLTPKKHENVILTMIKLLVPFPFIIWLNIQISIYFNLYPLTSIDKQTVLFAMIVFAYIFKGLRFVIFKWRLNKIKSIW